MDQVGVFAEESKVRSIGERFPGALTLETFSAMRKTLLTEAGEEGDDQGTKPVCLLYYRNHLAKKMNAASSREALNIATALDLLLRGRAAQAADVLSQRLKSQEAVALGSYWSIVQQLELPPQESNSLAGKTEMSSARKEEYEESRNRWMSKGNNKGDGKNKNKGKGDKNSWQKDDKKEDPGKNRGRGEKK